MASGPITSWEIDGETVETVSDLILGGSKITADGDCSHEIKRRLLLGRKVMTNLDNILKSKDITLPTEVHLKMKIMASGPITSWEIDRETVKQCQTLFLGGSKITADGDCSHEIKRLLLLGRKLMTNPDSLLKSRNITLPTKVRLVKAMVFPVVMYGCESWTMKKAEE